jgi:hypothetical protein
VRKLSSASESLELVRDFKKLLKTLVVPGGLREGPTVYPTTGEWFRILRPDLFAAAYPDLRQPIPSRIAKIDLLRLQYGMPCRSTKATCKGLPAARLSLTPAPTALDPAMQVQAMAVCLGEMLGMSRTRQPLAILDKGMDDEKKKKIENESQRPKLSPVAVPEVAGAAASGAAAGSKSPWPALPPSWTGEAPTVPGIGQSSTLPVVSDIGGKTEQEPSPMLMVKAMQAHLNGDSAAGLPKAGAQEPVAPGLRKRPDAAAVVSDTSASTKRPAAASTTLPSGWTSEEGERKSGLQKGGKYTLYFDKEGRQFRSWKAAVANM